MGAGEPAGLARPWRREAWPYGKAARRNGPAASTLPGVLRLYYVYFRFKPAGEKKPGPIRHVRIYANDVREARKLAAEQARYPDLEVVDVKEA